jgi:hypothetical protein
LEFVKILFHQVKYFLQSDLSHDINNHQQKYSKEITMAIEITIKKTKVNKGGKHKMIRSSKNRASGKYRRQADRSAANKNRNIEMNKSQGDPLAGQSLTQAAYK